MADNLSVSTKAIPASWHFWSAIPSVRGLLFHACPSAVVWAVSKMKVYAVYCLFSFWAITHVLQEGIKGLVPRIAYGYSSAAVVFKCGLVWVVAALTHTHPRNIFWANGAVGSLIVQRVCRALAASAASASPAPNCLSSNASFNSADASAKPVNTAPFSSGVIKNSPIGKGFPNLAGVVVGFVCIGHAPLYTKVISHE